MAATVRVSIYGAGQAGSAVRDLLAGQAGLQVLGPFGRTQRSEALSSGAEAVVIATTSFLADVGPDIMTAVAAGSNVITTAEEAAYPWHYHSALATELDLMARGKGVTILGAWRIRGWPSTPSSLRRLASFPWSGPCASSA